MPRKIIPPIPCSHCGKEFTTPYKRRYCSAECRKAGKLRMVIPEIECSHCGRMHTIKRQQWYSFRQGKRCFCSAKCRKDAITAAVSPKPDIECPQCKTRFSPSDSQWQDSKRGRRVFCSPVCRAAFKPSLEERFTAHTKRLPNGCLECDYAPSNKGYPKMSVNGRQYPISHVAWFLHYGWWPPETHEADHMCHIPGECSLGNDCPHRRCAEWSHLVLRVKNTGGNSSAERSNAGRVAAARNLAKTECPKGHKYDAKNTGYTKEGRRRCRKCHCEVENKRHRLRSLLRATGDLSRKPGRPCNSKTTDDSGH